MKWIPVLPLEFLVENRIIRFEAVGQPLVLVRQGDRVFALVDRCSHENFALSNGFVDERRIHCPLHGAAFDLETGMALTPPAYEDIQAFSVQIENGMVMVGIEE
jgi:3-phenylpropionate/trans-cinnamate dioxygenase ferredoxin component